MQRTTKQPKRHAMKSSSLKTRRSSSSTATTTTTQKRSVKTQQHQQTINKTTRQKQTTLNNKPSLSSPLFTTPQRQFAINLVNSATQSPLKTQTTKQQSEDEDSQLEDDVTPTGPVTYTTSDFILLPSAIKRLSFLNRGIADGSKSTQSGLRITVDTGGCSGFQYLYTMEDAPGELENGPSNTISSHLLAPKQAEPIESEQRLVLGQDSGDLFFIKNQHFVVTDLESMAFLKNSQLEYKTELIRSGFMVVNNPNVDLACGCGTSFSKKAGKNDV